MRFCHLTLFFCSITFFLLFTVALRKKLINKRRKKVYSFKKYTYGIMCDFIHFTHCKVTVSCKRNNKVAHKLKNVIILIYIDLIILNIQWRFK